MDKVWLVYCSGWTKEAFENGSDPDKEVVVGVLSKPENFKNSIPDLDIELGEPDEDDGYYELDFEDGYFTSGGFLFHHAGIIPALIDAKEDNNKRSALQKFRFGAYLKGLVFQLQIEKGEIEMPVVGEEE